MAESSSIQPLDPHARMIARARAYGYVRLALDVFSFLLALFYTGSLRGITVLLVSFDLFFNLIYLFLLIPRWPRAGAYLSLITLMIILSLVDPLTGDLSGASWVLFQAASPLAVLVLGEARNAYQMAGLSSITLLTIALLEINGVIPLKLLAPRTSLYLNLGLQIAVMWAIAIILSFIERRHNAEHEYLLALAEEAHKQAEKATAERQEAIRQYEALRTSAELIRETAAPVIPLLEHLIMVPLVGTMTPERGELLLDAVLRGIAEHAADYVLIDVTGTAEVDETAARLLVDTVNGARMSGAQCLLVGVQPELAQHLIELGIDLSALQARQSLREGLTYVLEQMGQRIISTETLQR